MANIINAITTGGGGLSTTADASGSIQIATNNGTTAMTIDTSQNVGIGTTSPTATLALASSLDFPFIHWNNLSNTNIGFLGWHGGSGGGDDFRLGTAGTKALTFQTNTTERMRITSGGDVLMGTALLALRGNGTLNLVNSSNGQIVYRNNTQGAGKYWFSGVESSNDVFFVYPGTTSGGVYLTYGATSWAGNSDERLKTNLKPIENAIEKVSTLRAVTGRFKADEEGVSRSFLIAQDVQAVLPEAVNTKDDEMGTLGLRYTDVIPLLTAAIKEQQTIINDLKARIETLEAK